MQGLVGESEALLDVFRIVDRVGASSCPVLVSGERGSGKERVARAVHQASPRVAGPFVAVRCDAIPVALQESELFGRVWGAPVGSAERVGRIARAQGGTLFLDEVEALPLPGQLRLLGVLRSGEYSPVGEILTRASDVRVVAATRLNLEDAVAEGTFLEELYFLLSAVHLRVPALRDRPDDVPLLAQHFLRRVLAKHGRDALSLSRGAAELLMRYEWPGNVRELESAIERAVLLCVGNRIEPGDLPAAVQRVDGGRLVTARLPASGVDLRAAVAAFEDQLIRRALERSQGNKKRAAELLGLNRTTLVEMLKRRRIG
jgi:DNA-binding NtrC family response regulator